MHNFLEEQLRERIGNNEWPPGTAFLSEKELTVQYGISRSTARTVLSKLEGAGLLYRIPGKGTFIAEPQTIFRNNGGNLCIRSQLLCQVDSISNQIIKKDQIPASKKIANKLQIAEGETVYEVVKVRHVKNVPFSLNTSYFPSKMMPDLLKHGLENDICTILKENYNITLAKASETLESCVATFSEADYIGVLPGHPLLLLCSQLFDETGTPYEYAKILFRGDRIRLSFNYDPAKSHLDA